MYLMKGCGAHQEEEVKAVEPAPVMDTVKAEAPKIGIRESLKVKLPDGTELDAYKGGIEDALVTCLNDAACAPGKDRWFDFDNINFEVGSAKLTAESDAQIRNIAAILKAYPKAMIKIGGYTDKTGDSTANLKLSQDRADAVLAAIKTAGGSAAQLLGAEGYGSAFAKVPADASDEARRTDRRISVSLREK
jgi:outer membrane protein OmpA-like peptidoglycan-associated protein